MTVGLSSVLLTLIDQPWVTQLTQIECMFLQLKFPHKRFKFTPRGRMLLGKFRCRHTPVILPVHHRFKYVYMFVCFFNTVSAKRTGLRSLHHYVDCVRR